MKPPNIELLDEVLEIIKNHPENWNQEEWHCGTSHCLAGHVYLIEKNLPPDTFIRKGLCNPYDVAQKALNISLTDADILFHSTNDMVDLLEYRNQLIKYGCIRYDYRLKSDERYDEDE